MRTRASVYATGCLVAALAAALSFAHGDKKWPVPEAARAVKNPVAATPAGLKAAKAIYDDKCLQCHGDKGKGDGSESMMYSTKPADFTDAHMMSEMTDGEIFYKMTEGREPMPSFKRQLTDEQRWQLVHYVRTFTPKVKPKHDHAEKKPAPKKQ
jgi:mono/diheme cytochrome c family protein